MSSVDFGRWKLVTRRSTTWNRKPGTMKSRVSADCARKGPGGRGRLERAQRRRADGHDAPAPRPRRGDRAHRRLGNAVPLLVHHVRGDVVAPHGLEGAGAHVQRHARRVDALRRERREHGLVEVQARRRRRDRARHGRVHGLVARLVVGRRGVRDVGRQRHLAVRGEDVEHRPSASKRSSKSSPRRPVTTRRHARREDELAAGPGRLARPHVGERRVGAQHALDEHLHLAAGVLAAAQPRLDHARVVEDEEVARIEERRQVAEGEVAQRRPTAPRAAGGSPRAPPPGAAR